MKGTQVIYTGGELLVVPAKEQSGHLKDGKVQKAAEGVEWSLSLLWVVKVKNNQVVPGGLVLKVNKQLIPRNDEPLCLT